MARTKNPSAATRKAWVTRKRNEALKMERGWQRKLGVDIMVPGTGTLRGNPRGGGASTGQASGDWRTADQKRIGRAEAELMGEVSYADPLGGGVSETYKVELDNGREAVFKPDEGGGGARAGIVGLYAERELGAWEVAKLVGMDDMVGVTVIREIEVEGYNDYEVRREFPPGTKRGSLTEWQEGDNASHVRESERFGNEHDLKRAGMFDYIIGNQDRHGGNWLVDSPFVESFEEPEPKIRLIDHNLAFGDDPVYLWSGNRFLLDELRDGRYSTETRSKPSEYAKPYVEKRAAIVRRLLDIGLSTDAVAQVARRIDEASVMEDWFDLWSAG